MLNKYIKLYLWVFYGSYLSRHEETESMSKNTGCNPYNMPLQASPSRTLNVKSSCQYAKHGFDTMQVFPIGVEVFRRTVWLCTVS